MAIEPTQENIQQVTEFSGCTREIAARVLKVRIVDTYIVLKVQANSFKGQEQRCPKSLNSTF